MGNLPLQGRAKATLRLRVYQVSSLHGIVQTEPVYIRNLQWRLRVMPLLNTNGDNMALGVFLYCEGPLESRPWSCKATTTFRLIHQERGVDPYLKEMASIFNSESKDWGYPYFLGWASLYRYINAEGDFLDIEAEVKADAPTDQHLGAWRGVMKRKARLSGQTGAETSEGVLRCRIKARDLDCPQKVSWYSSPKYIRGLEWLIKVVPVRGSDTVHMQSLRIIVSCRPNGHLEHTRWKCYADACFIIKAKHGNKSLRKAVKLEFQSGVVHQIGFRKFIDRESLLNPCNGYVKYSNSIELVVLVYAATLHILGPGS